MVGCQGGKIANFKHKGRHEHLGPILAPPRIHVGQLANRLTPFSEIETDFLPGFSERAGKVRHIFGVFAATWKAHMS